MTKTVKEGWVSQIQIQFFKGACALAGYEIVFPRSL
jgi:hypothetical protein